MYYTLHHQNSVK